MEYAYIFIIHLFRQKSIVKWSVRASFFSVDIHLCKNNKNQNEKSWRFVVDISVAVCYNIEYKGARLLFCSDWRNSYGKEKAVRQ